MVTGCSLQFAYFMRYRRLWPESSRRESVELFLDVDFLLVGLAVDNCPKLILAAANQQVNAGV